MSFPGIVSKQSVKTVASAATLDADADILVLTGTTEVDTLNVVNGGSGYSGQRIMIVFKDGAGAFGTTGNIAVAVTATQNRIYTLAYDPTTAKWYPSN